MRLTRMPTGQSQVAAEYSSHYEIVDSDLRSYFLSMDARAWHRYLRDTEVCPFCGSEVTLTGSCCQRFSEFRQAMIAKIAREKLSGQEDVMFKGGKIKGKKFGVTDKAKQRTEDHVMTRSV